MKTVTDEGVAMLQAENTWTLICPGGWALTGADIGCPDAGN